MIYLATRREKKVKIVNYTKKGFFRKLELFIGYKIYDVYRAFKDGPVFKEFGTTMYCGRQGAGKTVAMTEYLERMRAEYPKAIIVTNYNYRYQNLPFKDWKDFFDIRNGTDGVIFAIDEIQNEFDSAAWNKFPPALLSEITQQRKQRIKIVCTSQIFTRVAKPLREQCNDVVECKTMAGRWTFIKSLDAVDYNDTIDRPTAKAKIRRLYKKSFIQDAYLRELYDSYEKIQRIGRTEFSELEKRLSS